ncbi:MAG: stage III sporulation protein AB [Eubacteriales bacterium]|nr:stage III sporulation protein AB [Eubacteriales bacterium]
MDGFENAAALLPTELRRALSSLDPAIKNRAEEFRIRLGQRPTVLLDNGEHPLSGACAVDAALLRAVFERVTGASLYTHAGELRQGFICVQGGIRVGVCGRAYTDDRGIRGFHSISSLAVRIPREIAGCAEAFVRDTASFPSTIIISPPGGGKTTLLRDMIRLLSNRRMRVSLADERGEVAGVWNGEAQLDVGVCTDIMTGAPKAESAMLLLRAMNPQLLALDEITDPADVRACLQACNCGVRLLATAHARDEKDLLCRRLYLDLLENKAFDRAVIIRTENGHRSYREAWL